MKAAPIKTLFLDIGGVLLTNGWDTKSRKKAIAHFHLDGPDVEERHHLTFDTYEEGKLSMDEYLDRTIFYVKRAFTKADFKAFMYAESQELPGMLDFFKDLKREHKLKVVAVSNEARELNTHRINTFKLNDLFDTYISSCYVHIRKPDREILNMACDISQTPPEHGLYIDDRLMFVEVARSHGLQGIQHIDLATTKAAIEQLTFHKV